MSFSSRVVIDETGERVFIELTAEAALVKRDALRAEKRHAFIATQADELAAMLRPKGQILQSVAHPGSENAADGEELDVGDVSESALETAEIDIDGESAGDTADATA